MKIICNHRSASASFSVVSISPPPSASAPASPFRHHHRRYIRFHCGLRYHQHRPQLCLAQVCECTRGYLYKFVSSSFVELAMPTREGRSQPVPAGAEPPADSADPPPADSAPRGGRGRPRRGKNHKPRSPTIKFSVEVGVNALIDIAQQRTDQWNISWDGKSYPKRSEATAPTSRPWPNMPPCSPSS